jgi:hypothetical protein
MDFEHEKCAHPAPQGGHRVRSGRSLPLTGAKNNNNNNNNSKKIIEKSKTRGATRGLPKKSPILVLLSPKHAKLRCSDGIRFISDGTIAPVSRVTQKTYRPHSSN